MSATTAASADLLPFDAWPGEMEAGGIFVRRTPVLDPGAPQTLYVHGLGGSSLNWTDLMGLRMPVSAGIALDLPGFGWSHPVGRHTLDAHAAAVIGLLDRESAGPVNLVGNSMGGATAILVASRRPDLVRAVTLVSPALPGQRPKVAHAPILLAGIPGVGDRIRDMAMRRTPDQRVDDLLKLVYFDPECVTQERRAEALLEQDRRDELPHAWTAFAESAQSLGSMLLSPRTTSLLRELQRVRQPVLGLFGTHDQLVDVRVAPKAAKRIQRGRVVVMPRMGHVAQMEDPYQVMELMSAFESEFVDV